MKIKDMTPKEQENVQRICIEHGIVNLVSEEMTLEEIRKIISRHQT